MNSALHHKERIVEFVRGIYGPDFIPLHRPVFAGNEKKYLAECIDSNFVSSVGQRVNDLEQQLASFTGARFAIAAVNGTAALHIALVLAGVRPDDEVMTQPLTFVATCNALSYCHAHPVFVDVDKDTLGMSPTAVARFLEANVVVRDGKAVNRTTGRRVAACVPMHTFGLPCRIDEIVKVCSEFGIPVIEDAAESLGSYVGERHTGTIGAIGTLSFNGNKVITTGGGGAIITNDEEIAKRAKHLTTTAKRPHPYEFFHDEVGYNYRMPNLNAALGCAQMEQLPGFLETKQGIARRYAAFFSGLGIPFLQARAGTRSNHWLNAILLESKAERDEFLRYTNDQGVMTRPIWTLMNHLPMFSACQRDDLVNSLELEQRVVNISSSVPDPR
ncbi:LegC family aminotransferase [Ramlibacter albus]|uniref:GDP-perosamine synthase n=1 Tax=Ramlibacter albus TaxID=2079448 RepID=A0A923MCK8_9BURK|nr:LegC family aminotransferase [Ramlibacter albus]MBC5766933.1 LegC family aminotransferase [Ramlibacter albus]